METYACEKCGFSYTSPIHVTLVEHTCKNRKPRMTPRVSVQYGPTPEELHRAEVAMSTANTYRPID